MKSLSLQGLENLKGVDIQGVREVEIDVPNIERIYYGAVSHKPCKMNFDSCKNLRDLTIMNTKTDFVISDKWFLNLFANSPLLESLKLEECFMSEKIGISSSQLKSLVLSNCSTMEEIEIDTPNLASFRYYFAGDDLPSIHFRRYSSQLDVNVKLHMIPTCLHQLGKFVKQFRPRKLLTSLSLSMRQEYQNYHYWYPEEEDEEEEEDPFSLPAKVPAPVIEHLFIRSVREIKPDDYLLFVYRLFHCWYPETISLSLNPSHGSKEFIKV
ncbi:hypothetical protein PIB30_048690 [Stylosanthes scabra]|uniref:At1g61320/AtMIF1 LRR domain-containing protein n=1 Tax=Stylosanthes scabra TaxID=79078 RepID=A0ABU6SI18_9FABA|nr:hypothetical protein [Stylosanthes scabra]